MKRKTVYVAGDNTEFDSEQECLEYEQRYKIEIPLTQFVSQHIPYCDDAGFSCFSTEETVNFIMFNYEIIKHIFETSRGES